MVSYEAVYYALLFHGELHTLVFSNVVSTLIQTQEAEH